MLTTTGQFDAALEIIAALRGAGYEAYLAGGCVRDLLLGLEPKDYDVATSATPDVVLEMFPRTFAVGAHFGVVLVATGGGADTDGTGEAEWEESRYVVTEVATFRSDGAYSDGRHPDAVKYTKSAEEDVQRRDFTINGLLLDPAKLIEAGLSESHPSHKDNDVARVGHPAEKGGGREGLETNHTAGAKAPPELLASSARLKSCPDTGLGS